jgi:hypothetical protein
MFPKNIAPLLDSGSLAPIAANASLEQATLLRWGGSCVQHRLLRLPGRWYGSSHTQNTGFWEGKSRRSYYRETGGRVASAMSDSAALHSSLWPDATAELRANLLTSWAVHGKLKNPKNQIGDETARI